MNHTVIISDIHLGSPHCRKAALIDFLRSLPDEAGLILNGDVVDRYHVKWQAADDAILDELRGRSRRAPVIWIRGNHDRHFHLESPEGIEMRHHLLLDHGLYVSHGDEFETVLRYARPFTLLLRIAYRCSRIALRRPPDDAEFVKNWHFLYAIAHRHVRANAVRYARRHDFHAVVSGHTHVAEDTTIRGIRYLNTGAWTESPVYAVNLTGREIDYRRVYG